MLKIPVFTRRHVANDTRASVARSVQHGPEFPTASSPSANCNCNRSHVCSQDNEFIFGYLISRIEFLYEKEYCCESVATGRHLEGTALEGVLKYVGAHRLLLSRKLTELCRGDTGEQEMPGSPV